MLIKFEVAGILCSECWLMVERHSGWSRGGVSVDRFIVPTGSDLVLTDVDTGEYVLRFECGLSELLLPVGVEAQSFIDLGIVKVPFVPLISRMRLTASSSLPFGSSIRGLLIFLTCALSVVEGALIVVAYLIK